MVHSLSNFDFWYGKESNSKIDIYCMLPTGILITFPLTKADTPLQSLKTELWVEAKRYAMYNMLNPQNEYSFVIVSTKGGQEEVIDESQSLFDLKPVRPYLKIVKRQGDAEVKKLNSKINMLIGRSITGKSKLEEVNDFRSTCIDFCEKISDQRGKSSWECRAIYTYPPEFESDEMPMPLKEKLDAQSNRLQISLVIMKNTSHTFEVPDTIQPKELIDMALRKRGQTMNLSYREKPEEYVLKVVGRLSFFLGQIVKGEDNKENYVEKPIINYKYIRECIMWDNRPRLKIVAKNELDVIPVCAALPSNDAPQLPPKSQGNEICLWDLSPSTMLKIKISCALNVNAGQMWKEVHCGLFHGGEELCEKKCTSLQSGIHPKWNEFLNFDISVADIPRMARLCFSIVGYRARDKKRRQQPALIAWVNVPIFNYKGILRCGSVSLPCWQQGFHKKNIEKANLLNPLGTIASSDNENGPCINVEFMSFAPIVRYPSDDTVFERAAQYVEESSKAKHPFLLKGARQHRLQIEEVIKKDALSSMHPEDKELLWTLRADCYYNYPNSLPKLLQCVKWNSREYVSQIHLLLQTWRTSPDDLEVEIALDLLDYKFPDLKVRSLAVKVLNNLSDNELEMYLLQLVQALKFESYLDSPLARYLLKRALNNRRIGHYLFWHLKAEVTNQECSLQFGLLLEMYCRGSVEHIDILLTQVKAIGKMKTVTEFLQSYKDDLVAPDDAEKSTTRDAKKLNLMHKCLKGCEAVFQNLISPLDPNIKLKSLIIEKCKFMSSKKKPLWLVFENDDEGADRVTIIFKNGDDLRQDMLTLLSLRLMENIWKKAGIDPCIIPYRCLSTGPMVGLIEAVPNSETLGLIQAEPGAISGVLNEKTLYQWLEKQCRSRGNLENAIESFTKSVVGYSVATYVLGIGDRHNDNIMMKKDTGQLFHIDFGHFLGNFKYKFGIKRERVKFVLTSDITYIIKQRTAAKENENFDRFRKMCIEAFLTLRSKGNLFITVFAMLLSSGIPELETPSDLNYIRDYLALNKDENEAVKIFEASFDEANKNRSTTLNWMVHNIQHRWIG